jgi:hypothetical protein
MKFLILVLLVSCEVARSPWEDAPEKYICNNKELALVKAEFDVCNDSSYQASYCYASGLMKYCRLKKGN